MIINRQLLKRSLEKQTKPPPALVTPRAQYPFSHSDSVTEMHCYLARSLPDQPLKPVQIDYLTVSVSQKSGHSFSGCSAVKVLARSRFSSGSLPEDWFTWSLASLIFWWVVGLKASACQWLQAWGRMNVSVGQAQNGSLSHQRSMEEKD